MFTIVDLRSLQTSGEHSVVEDAMSNLLNLFQNDSDGDSLVVAETSNNLFHMVCSLTELRSLGIEKCVETYINNSKKGNQNV